MTAGSLTTTPSALRSVGAIAQNTFREAIRDRVLYLLLAFAVTLIVVSRLVALLTVGDEGKIIKDVGLSAISVFGMLAAVFVGTSLVFKEIERRTVYTLLANPVRRWHFVCGKFLGLLAVLAANLALMSLVLFGILFVWSESVGALVPAIFLILVELTIIAAFALLFSSLTSPILAAVSTFAVYVMGHLSWSLKLLQERVPEGPARVLCDVVYWTLPNLDRLDVKLEAVHALPLPSGLVVLGTVYGIGYAALVLVLACLAFARKDFL